MREHLFFVGPGRVGLSLGYALWQAEAVGSLVYCGRRPEPPSHPLFTQGNARYVFGLERPAEGTTAVLLSVPDGALPEVATALAGQGEPPGGAAAFHLSGALTTDPLAPLHARGYSVGTLHPFQTIAHPLTGADLLPGSYFAVSGEPQATSVARRILHALGSPSISVPVTRRPLYHVAGVLASNYVQVMLETASRLLVRAGFARDESYRALLSLSRGALQNLEEMGSPEQALTGPLARGELDTVDLHLRTLEPAERGLYARLGRHLLKTMPPADLDEDRLAELTKLLEEEDGR